MSLQIQILFKQYITNALIKIFWNSDQVDRGYQYVRKYLEKEFPNAEILIPPNVSKADGDSQKPKKRVLNQADADYQEIVKLHT